MTTSGSIDNEKQKELWAAAAAGDCAKIRILAMSEQVNVNSRNEDGFDAFNIATQAGKAEAATTILAAREVQYMREIGMVSEAVSHDDAETKNTDGKKTA